MSRQMAEISAIFVDLQDSVLMVSIISQFPK